MSLFTRLAGCTTCHHQHFKTVTVQFLNLWESEQVLFSFLDCILDLVGVCFLAVQFKDLSYIVPASTDGSRFLLLPTELKWPDDLMSKGVGLAQKTYNWSTGLDTVSLTAHLQTVISSSVSFPGNWMQLSTTACRGSMPLRGKHPPWHAVLSAFPRVWMGRATWCWQNGFQSNSLTICRHGGVSSDHILCPRGTGNGAKGAIKLTDLVLSLHGAFLHTTSNPE